ncbi:MAG: hypothetical protein ACHP7I_00805 [Terriglobales bacterium]
MSWSEDDFLERLMPQLRRELGGGNGACPDAATVLAVIEGEASDWLRNVYAQHLAQCSACLELDSRLRSFDRPVLVKDEAEWKQTEKRLDNWLSAHLESRAAASRRAAEQRASRPGFWESIWRPGLAWRISWALGLVALIAIGSGVYVKSQRPVPPQEAKAPALATPGAAPGIELPAENAHPKSAAPESTAPQMASAPQPPSEVKPRPEPVETATATSKASPSVPQKQAALELPARKNRDIAKDQKAAIDQARQRALQKEQAEKQSAIAAAAKEAEPQLQASATPHSGRPAATTSSSRSFDKSFNATRTVALPPNAVPNTGRAPSARVAPNLPASLHLDAGVRLWIVLASVNRQADGSFSFRGSLLQPLNSAGSSKLDRDTEVSGSGTVAQSRTSLLISQIVFRGASYKLKIIAGSGHAQTTGSGGVVPFENGKVFEMWLSSESDYEREPPPRMAAPEPQLQASATPHSNRPPATTSGFPRAANSTGTPAASRPPHGAVTYGGRPPSAAHQSQGEWQAVQASDVLTNPDVLKMAKAKFADGIIISKIKASACNFDTSVDALVKLKEAGVSDPVIQAMHETQEMAIAAAQEPALAEPPAAQPGEASAPAPMPGQVSFSVRHRHSNAAGWFVQGAQTEYYCSGTLSVSADGTVAFDCAQTEDPSGRCEHLSFAPGSLKEVKIGLGGNLHLASKKQGSVDFYGNADDIKQAQAAIAPLIKK